MKFKEIIQLAKDVKAYTEKHRKLPDKMDGLTKPEYAYILVRSVLNPNKEINKLSYPYGPNPHGDTILKVLTKNEYLAICKEVNKFINEHKRFPNYDKYQDVKVSMGLLTYCNTKIIDFYNKNGRLPATCKFDSSIFKTKKNEPEITSNDAHTYFIKKTGFKGTTLDEILAYVKKHGSYEKYFNGHKTNKTMTDKMAGNCTDWLQWLINQVEPLGYEWKCIHVKCRVSGTGHVRGQFRHKKHTSGNWINRDPAAVASGGSITSIWCDDGILIDTNPSWFMEDLRR